MASPFDGSPTAKGRGDWTYCGVSLFEVPRYAVDGAADQLGALQQTHGGKTADDAYRYFPPNTERGLLTYLPLTAKKPQVLVPFQDGNTYDDARGGVGFWMPSRKIEPVGGTIAIRQMHIDPGGFGTGTAILIGEASHVVIDDIYTMGGCVQTVGNLNCGVTGGLLEMRNCNVLGGDSSVYCHSMTIHATNLSGGGGEAAFRLVGCRGYVQQLHRHRFRQG